MEILLIEILLMEILLMEILLMEMEILLIEISNKKNNQFSLVQKKNLKIEGELHKYIAGQKLIRC